MTLEINRGKTAEQLVREHLQREQELARQSRNGGAGSGAGAEAGSGGGMGGGNIPPNPVRVINVGDYVKLENLVCIDADNHEFERYNELYVRKDVEKSPTGQMLTFTPYNAIHHLEQQGDFLPSSALMANILVAVYRAAVEKQADGTYRTKDAGCEKVLQKFKNRGDGAGGHWVDTVVNWGTQQVIHYPRDADFPSNGGNHNINTSRSRVAQTFNRTGFTDTPLVNALALPNYKRYVQNYTGLPDPAVLIEIAEYFGKTARCWISSSNETRAAWFGCSNSDSFNLYAYNSLDNAGAARGVRLSAPQGAP